MRQIFVSLDTKQGRGGPGTCQCIYLYAE